MSLRWLLLFVGLLDCCVSADEQVTAETGQTVALSCRVNNRNIIRVVEWIRADLEEEGYVLLYRNNQFDTEQQHPSFKYRVELKQGWKEDGDVSVILKNVMTADSGRYECRVRQEGTEPELINTISLSVLLPGHSGGHEGGGDKEGGDKEGGDKERSSGGPVGPVVGVTLLVNVAAAVAVVGFMIYRRLQMRSSPPPPPLYKAVKVQLL